jgi:hypothetical protein
MPELLPLPPLLLEDPDDPDDPDEPDEPDDPDDDPDDPPLELELVPLLHADEQST